MKTLWETCVEWIILTGEPYQQGQLGNLIEKRVKAQEKIIFEKVSKDNFNNRTLKVLMKTAKELGFDQPCAIALQTKYKLDKMVGEIKTFDENFDFEGMFSGKMNPNDKTADWEEFPLKFWETRIDLDLGDNEGCHQRIISQSDKGKFMYECKDYVFKRVISGCERLLNCASVQIYVDGNIIKVDIEAEEAGEEDPRQNDPGEEILEETGGVAKTYEETFRNQLERLGGKRKRKSPERYGGAEGRSRDSPRNRRRQSQARYGRRSEVARGPEEAEEGGEYLRLQSGNYIRRELIQQKGGTNWEEE